MIERPIIIRGGGDLASGVAARLHRATFPVFVLELEKPMAVRRTVAFAQAVYAGEVEIEGVRGRLAVDLDQAAEFLQDRIVPVLIDPDGAAVQSLTPPAVIDGRMRKRPPEQRRDSRHFSIGLGPGFTAGVNCDAVVETNRGHDMGRVYWEGGAEVDTGVPDAVSGFDVDRVIRSPAAGAFQGAAEIGSIVDEGQLLGEVAGESIRARFRGALRGLLHDGVEVERGVKLGDLDPRCVPDYCFRISDKSLAVGGGVLEILLQIRAIRQLLRS